MTCLVLTRRPAKVRLVPRVTLLNLAEMTPTVKATLNEHIGKRWVKGSLNSLSGVHCLLALSHSRRCNIILYAPAALFLRAPLLTACHRIRSARIVALGVMSSPYDLYFQNPNDTDAAQRFQEMAEAYETLIDPDAREDYDRFGLDGGPGHGMGGMDPEELFAQMFGGGMPFDMGGGPGRPKRGGKGKGEDSIIEYSVTLEDLFNGKSPHFNTERGIMCPTCKG